MGGRSDQLLLNKFFHPSNFSFAFPLRGKANKSWTPQIKKTRSLLYSNMGAANNFRQISFLIRATFCLPSPFGGRQTSLGPPKSKIGDHLSIVIWALRTTFAK